MIVVVDNDVMELLATWDLLDELPAAFGVTEAALRVVDTAKYRYHVKDPVKGRKKFGTTWDRIVAFLGRVQLISEAHEEDLSAAAGVLNFDPGEVILCSFVSRTPDAVFLTGDKRAIDALAQSPSLQPMRQRMGQRVIPLEQVIERLFASCGFEKVRDAAVTSSTTHITTRVVFGSGPLTTRESATAALHSYAAALIGRAPDLFRPP